MSNPFHIDLVSDYTGGDFVGEEFVVKTGANSLTLKASDLGGGVLSLQFQPVGSAYWYSKPAGDYDAGKLDSNDQAWDNVLLGEGKVRAVLTGSVGAVIEEMMLRPTHETELEL